LVSLFLFEISEIQEQSSAHNKSLIFLRTGSREMNGEVISIADHSLHAARTLLLDTGNSVTRRNLNIEVNGFTAFEGSLAVHTDLHAASVNVVLNVVILIVDVQNQIAAVEGISNLSKILALAILNPSNRDFGSVTAIEGTGAWSVNQEERTIIEFLIIIFEIDLELERSAFTAQELSFAAARFFLALEELLAFLITVLANGINIVSVFTLTAGHSFHKFHLLLDEDTISSIESIETLHLLLRGSMLLESWLLESWLLESWLETWLLESWLLETWLRVSRLAIARLLRVSRLWLIHGLLRITRLAVLLLLVAGDLNGNVGHFCYVLEREVI
jgi:hypothetical protein